MVTTQERSVSAWKQQVDTKVRVAGSGPPVVFLHGAFGLQWDPFLDALAERFTVYAPEHPGTTPGKPDEIKPIDNLWDLVLYYYELFDALKLDAPAVIGHSFGAMVAAEVAATNPARVSKLVLIGPVGLWRDDAPVRNWMATPMPELPKYLFADQNSPMAKIMAGGAATLAGGEVPEAVIDMQVQLMWSLACTGKFVWPIPDRGLRKRLHRIAAPTLIVQGKQDGIVPPLYADEFASKIANAKVLMVDGAAHLPQVEQPATVVPAVTRFLEG
jgi:pimeloyl-ACP methyl ester carboxylesterase